MDFKYTVLQWSTVTSKVLSGVAPWCSQRTASPPLTTLTSIQNIGGLSPPSIDIHGNYDHFRRTYTNQSKLFQYELTCCPSNHSMRIRE